MPVPSGRAAAGTNTDRRNMDENDASTIDIEDFSIACPECGSQDCSQSNGKPSAATSTLSFAIYAAARWREASNRNGSPVMTDMPETFETFLRSWIAENVDSLGSQTDATNLKYILRVRADELEKAATIKGFYGELAEAARPYGGIEGYVQHQFEEARRG
jgi:hypothetical protein